MCLIPYTVPKVHKELFKREVKILIVLGILDKYKNSECGSPSFVQPKLKSNWVRFQSNFINIYIQLNCKPYKMPKINEMIFKLEGFQYATSLDLNMWYCHIQLSENASYLCAIFLPWGLYRYKQLTMVVTNS